MGREADRGRVRLQPEHGEALPWAWLDALPQAGAGEGAGRARGLAGGTVSAASRQRRRGAAGGAGRTRDRGEPAHGRARGGTAAPGARGRGAGNGPVRDAAWQADAGRLRREASGDRWRDAPGVPVRRHARPLASPARARFGTSARPAGSKGWRARSGRSAGCRRRSCSTTPGRW
jgi:hypothetical protein